LIVTEAVQRLMFLDVDIFCLAWLLNCAWTQGRMQSVSMQYMQCSTCNDDDDDDDDDETLKAL